MQQEIKRESCVAISLFFPSLLIAYMMLMHFLSVVSFFYDLNLPVGKYFFLIVLGIPLVAATLYTVLSVSVKNKSSDCGFRELFPFITGFVGLILWSSGYYFIGLMQSPSRMHSLATFFDGRISIIPSTVFIYLTVYTIFLLSFFTCSENSRSIKILITFISMLILNYLLMYIYPVSMERVIPEGSTTADMVLRLVQSSDVPHNCFPSSHCSVALLSALIIQEHKNKSLKIFSWVSAIGISLTTVTTKQHFFLDIIGGWILAIVLWYFIYNNEKIGNFSEYLRVKLNV